MVGCTGTSTSTRTTTTTDGITMIALPSFLSSRGEGCLDEANTKIPLERRMNQSINHQSSIINPQSSILNHQPTNQPTPNTIHSQLD